MKTAVNVPKRLKDPFAIIELRIAYTKPHRQLIGDDTYKMWITTRDPIITLVKQTTLERKE